MLIDLPCGIPDKISIDSQEHMTVKVYRRGFVSEKPKDWFLAYVPENNARDIPRTLAACSTKEWTYRENVEITAGQKQRPSRIKYMMLHPECGTWYIEIIDSLGSYGRKIKETERKLALCRNDNCPFTGIILIIKESIQENSIESRLWPQDIALCKYERK